jgi:hypothetical protein
MATVDLVGIRPLMQATLAALFKFEMFDGVGDEQQTTLVNLSVSSFHCPCSVLF